MLIQDIETIRRLASFALTAETRTEVIRLAGSAPGSGERAHAGSHAIGRKHR